MTKFQLLGISSFVVAFGVMLGLWIVSDVPSAGGYAFSFQTIVDKGLSSVLNDGDSDPTSEPTALLTVRPQKVMTPTALLLSESIPVPSATVGAITAKLIPQIGDAPRESTPNPNAVQADDAAEIVRSTFEVAEEAFADANWVEAIRAFENLHSLDSTYKQAIVSEHLTIAYLSAALEAVETNDDLASASRYFRKVLIAEPNNRVAVEESGLLELYIAGTRALNLNSAAEAIDALEPIYETRPDYLGGLAVQRLYEAYRNLGDDVFRSGNIESAKHYFEQAENLNVADKSQVIARLTSLEAILALTPTPYPENLATVQAFARKNELPVVVLSTPTPNSTEEANAQSDYATAVALTTGTFTPVPQNFVTPMLVLPSPPAESLATEAARLATATAVAADPFHPSPTPLPHNAVMAAYVFATEIPDNSATAAAHAVIAEANALVHGTPTPLAWNVVVITRQPTSTSPPPTPEPTHTALPLLIRESELTPTSTSTRTPVVPVNLPPELRNKIVFLSDRGGATQTYVLDPITDEISLVTQDWVHPKAREKLTYSPDNKHVVVVRPDHTQILQLMVGSLEYNTFQQVTAVNVTENSEAIAYDPAWSPVAPVIAYVSSESLGDEIYTVNIESNVVQRLTHNSWEWDKHPTWSPDGSQIVFYSNRDTGRRQLWIMDADGSNQRNLSNSEYNDWDPIWTR